MIMILWILINIVQLTDKAKEIAADSGMITSHHHRNQNSDLDSAVLPIYIYNIGGINTVINQNHVFICYFSKWLRGLKRRTVNPETRVRVRPQILPGPCPISLPLPLVPCQSLLSYWNKCKKIPLKYTYAIIYHSINWNNLE